MVVINYAEGVIAFESYKEMNGADFVDLMCRKTEDMFQKQTKMGVVSSSRMETHVGIRKQLVKPWARLTSNLCQLILLFFHIVVSL